MNFPQANIKKARRFGFSSRLARKKRESGKMPTYHFIFGSKIVFILTEN